MVNAKKSKNKKILYTQKLHPNFICCHIGILRVRVCVCECVCVCGMVFLYSEACITSVILSLFDAIVYFKTAYIDDEMNRESERATTTQKK